MPYEDHGFLQFLPAWFPLTELIDKPGSAGRCPWCATLLVYGSTAGFADAVRRAEGAGSELVKVLGRLGDDWARFRIDPEAIRKPIERTLADHNEATADHKELRRPRRQLPHQPAARRVARRAGTAAILRPIPDGL